MRIKQTFSRFNCYKHLQKILNGFFLISQLYHIDNLQIQEKCFDEIVKVSYLLSIETLLINEGTFDRFKAWLLQLYIIVISIYMIT